MRRVLIVEDEPLLRLLAADLLSELGIEVIEAPNADIALALFQSDTSIDGVFTDIQMPGSIDGLSLARKVSEARPDVRLVVTSGMLRPGPGELPVNAVFLAKPYAPASLVEHFAVRVFA